MNQQEMFDIQPEGKTVKGTCSCGQVCDCVIVVYSNGTKHAVATCPKCGKKNAKRQEISPSLNELDHRLKWIYSMIEIMPKGVDRDEAICMVERFSIELEKFYE